MKQRFLLKLFIPIVLFLTGNLLMAQTIAVTSPASQKFPAFTTTYGLGTATSQVTFTTSGYAPGDNITVKVESAVSSDFTISIDGGVTYNTSFILGPLTSTSPNTTKTIIIKLNSTVNAQNAMSLVAVEISDLYSAPTKIPFNSPCVVNKAPLTVDVSTIGAITKQYDANNIATVPSPSNATLSGTLYNGDLVTLDAAPSNYIYSSVNASVSSISVTPTAAYTITQPATNYILTQPTLSGTITKKALSISGTNIPGKDYDGDDVCHTIHIGTITGNVVGETPVTTASAVYPSKNANAAPYNVTVNYSLVNNGAFLASNYSLASHTVPSTIYKKALTITGSSIAGVTYNGLSQSGAVTIGSVTGYASGETLNITATAANYGAAAGPYTTTITYVLADNLPNLASNYSIAAQPNVSATIFKKQLIMSIPIPSILDKTYDGTKTAGGLTAGSYSSGIVVGEAVPTITPSASDYSYSAAGVNYSSTVSYALSGPTASNYFVAPVTLNNLKILKKDVTVSSVTPMLADKQYDGTSLPPVSVSGFTVNGTIVGETLNVTATGTNYLSADVGNYTSNITVDITNGNAWSGNYNLTGTITFPAVPGKIVPKPLTFGSVTVTDKEYDATVIVNPGTVTLGVPTGLIGTETLNFSPVVPINLYGNYVGTYNINIPVSLSDAGVGPTLGKAINYTATAYNVTVKIKPKKLTLVGANTLNTIASKTYDGTKATGAVTVGKTYTGTVAGQVVTISAVGEFTGPNAGDYNVTNQPCVLKYTVNDGPTFDKGFNYAIDDEIGYTAQVEQRKVTITGLKAGNQKASTLVAPYTTTLTGTPAIKNLVASDAGNVVVTQTPGAVTAKFADNTVGQGKPITLTNSYGLGGSRAFNYVVNQQPVLTASVYQGDGEIGNRIWDDTNADGLQDDDELGIAGVKVQLYDKVSGIKVTGADAITDAQGYYLFSPNAAPGGPISTSSIYGLSGLTVGPDYIVRVPDVNGVAKQAVLGTKNLTVYEVGTDRSIDSDGQLVPEGADAVVKAPSVGVDFDEADFGFTSGAPSGGGSGGGGGVSGGGVGGLESKSLGDAVGNRLFESAINSTNVPVDYSKLPGISRIGIQRAIAGVGTKLTLKELLPTQINGTSYKAFATTPKDLTAITNAKDVMSIDFTLNNQAKAVAFGMITAGEVYDHTKAICDRLKGAELQSLQSVEINKIPMVNYKLKNNLGQTEYVMSFVVGAKTGRNYYTVQSNWLNKDYSVDEIMYNIQLWAATPEDVSTMATDILKRLASGQTIVQVPSPKGLPTTYLTKGKRSSDKIELEVNNQSAVTNGYFEIAEKSNEQSATLVKKQIPFTLKANGLTSINIPTSDIYESTLSLYLNGVLQDEVFISDGNWAAQVNSSATSTVKSLKVTNDPSFVTENKDDFKLFRNVQIEASTPDFVSVYKMLRGGGAPQDLTGYKSFQFTAKGSGATMYITLVKDGIPNWADQYSLSMPLSSTTQDYKISLDDFVSKATKDKINPKDVTMVIFGLVVNGGRLADISADISKVSFSKTDIAYLNSLNSKEIGVYPNPAKGGSFVATFKAPVASTLMMNVTDASTGKLIFTKSVNAQMGTNNVPVHINQQVGFSTYILSLEGTGVKYTPKKLFIEK